MQLLFLVAAQAATGAAPERIDLTIPPPCGTARAAGDEIIVCAPGSRPYRINQPAAGQSELPKAEVRIARGVRASAETEQVDVGGFPSNRVVIRLKFSF